MFYDRLKGLCAARGTTPTALLRELGLSTGSLANYKKGTVPKGRVLHLLSQGLGVSVAQLLGEDPGEERFPTTFTRSTPPPRRGNGAFSGDRKGAGRIRRPGGGGMGRGGLPPSRRIFEGPRERGFFRASSLRKFHVSSTVGRG